MRDLLYERRLEEKEGYQQTKKSNLVIGFQRPVNRTGLPRAMRKEKKEIGKRRMRMREAKKEEEKQRGEGGEGREGGGDHDDVDVGRFGGRRLRQGRESETVCGNDQ